MGGGCLIQKIDDEKFFFLLWFGHFSRIVEENDQNPNTVRNFSPHKKQVLKKVPQMSHNKNGGGMASRPLRKQKIF